MTIKLPDVTGKRPIQAFVNAVESIDSGFTVTIKAQLLQGLGKEDPEKAFRDVIRQFRDWRQMSHDSKSRGSHSAFLSTLQGQTANGESADTNESPSQGKKGKKYKDCICGESHSFASCKYLMESKRPTGWQPKKAMLEKIEETLDLPEWKQRKEVIERMQKADKEKKTSKDASKETTKRGCSKTRRSQSQKPDFSADDVPTPACAMGHVMTRAAYTASGGFIDDDDEEGLFPLIDSVILDSGATVHIFNDRSRFISFREPASNDVCTAGTQTVPIRGWGSIMIQVTRRIDGPDSRPREVKVPIRLDEVAYIPNFNVNAAALRRFIRKGIHWDTEGEQLKFRGKNWANAPDIEQQ